MKRPKRASNTQRYIPLDNIRNGEKARRVCLPSLKKSIKVRVGSIGREFLGTGQTWFKSFVPYEEAQARVQHAEINSRAEYQEWQKKHEDMPSAPNETYLDQGWINWGEFLGTKRTRTKLFVSYEEAQRRVQAKGLSSSREYKEWRKSQEGMPSQPEKIYEDKGWIDWGEFLGTGRTSSRAFLPHVEAQRSVQEAEERNALRE